MKRKKQQNSPDEKQRQPKVNFSRMNFVNAVCSTEWKGTERIEKKNSKKAIA